MLLSAAATGMMMIGAQGDVSSVPLLPTAAAVEATFGAQNAPPYVLAQATPPADPAPAAAPAAPAAALVPPATATTAPDDEDQADIVVTGEQGAPPGDPLEKLNAQSFEAVQSVDKAVLQPVAQAYNKGLPRPVRKGLRNFFSNLGEPVVFLAYLLQFKPGKAIETAGRFGINTTLGFVGLFDVAKRKPFYLPYRPNGLANTLGYYGVGPGPYMYLPLVGPTTLRDIIGDTVDKMALPFAVGKPFNKPSYVIPAAILDQLGERAAFDERIQEIRKEDDSYAAYRELYLSQRKAEIEALHGRVTPGVVPVYGPGLKVPGKKDAPDAPAPEAPAAAAPMPDTAVPAAQPDTAALQPAAPEAAVTTPQP